MTSSPSNPRRHPFLRAPHRTLLALSWPVLLSLVAEPLTGLADTAFVSRLGAAPVAALGVGTMALSSAFWVFNFLGVGSQTRVAQFHGRGQLDRAAETATLALGLGVVFGLLLALAAASLLPLVAAAMGAEGEVHRQVVAYMRIRLWGAPAVISSTAAFGVLRGLQDMRTPFWVATAVNLLNIVLDAVFIFGLGPLPAFGVAGAAAASTLSQYLGMVWAAIAVGRRLGTTVRIRLGDVAGLFAIGRDLFIRTGLLTLFLLLATRAATQMGPAAGAAHQAVRQVWLFTALFLDAFAITGQSLIGYFYGSRMPAEIRRVARVVCLWSLATGGVLGLAMILGIPAVVWLLVPPPAVAVFLPAWWAAALTQPVNALAFATDGIHWGTADFGFLRNVVALATASGIAGLWLLARIPDGGLTGIWCVTGVWIGVRALFGVLRVWPGIGGSPFTTPDA